MGFRKTETDIPGLLIFEPDVYGDERGYFKETYNKSAFAELGFSENFVQDNLSRSTFGVLRGLHFQAPPHAQGKLVTVLEGKVLDVAVDIRNNSPAYGKHLAIELTAENHKLFYIPPGFAHGFAVLSETCLFSYKCTDVYAPQSEGGLIWNDPELQIDWKLDSPTVSEKDQKNPKFAEFTTPFE